VQSLQETGAPPAEKRLRTVAVRAGCGLLRWHDFVRRCGDDFVRRCRGGLLSQSGFQRQCFGHVEVGILIIIG